MQRSLAAGSSGACDSFHALLTDYAHMPHHIIIQLHPVLLYILAVVLSTAALC
jgi:hypothetical protein